MSPASASLARVSLSRCVACVACAALARAQASAPQVSQPSPWPMPVVKTGDGRALGDIDNDGDLDMATRWGDGAILLHAGDDSGMFHAQPPGLVVAATLHAQLAIADLDADGLGDVIGGGFVHWGNGTFNPTSVTPTALPVSTLPEFEIADLNHDGRLDLVTGAVTAVLTLGPATLSAPIASPSFFSGQEFELLDADGDSRIDFVSRAGTVVFARAGDGQGAFGLEHLLFTLPAATTFDLASADIDGDGDVDLCAVHGNQSALSIELRSQVPGSFALLSTTAFMPQAALRDVQMADISGDGFVDVVALDAGGRVYPFLGNGAGQCDARASSYIAHDGTRLVLGDVERDGRVDVTATQAQLTTSSLDATFVLSGAPDGLATPRMLDVGFDLHALRTGAFVPGGGIDAVCLGGTWTSGSLAWLQGDGQGELHVVATTPLSAWNFSERVLRLDHDGDGIDEIAIVRSLQGVALYGAQAPSGALQSLALPAVIQACGAGDVDQDGRDDLVLVLPTSGVIPLFSAPGGWTIGAPIHASSPGELPLALALANVDGQGAPDLVAAHASGLVTFQTGVGDGTFLAPLTIGTASYPADVRVFDINGDGRLDVHVQSAQSEGVLYTFVHALSHFAAPSVIGCQAEYAIADADLDGRVDLLSDGLFGHPLVMRRGIGEAFAPIAQEQFFGSGDFAHAHPPAVGDLDSDGRADLVLFDGKRVGVVLHRDYATPGTQSIGSGTSGCSGAHTLSAATQPRVGNAAFALHGTQAPPSSFGIGLLSTVADPAGSDPLLLGPLFHVGLGGAFAFGVASDASGAATRTLPIPTDPSLVGSQIATQLVWPWSTGPCTPTQPLALSSSPGLVLTFVP